MGKTKQKAPESEEEEEGEEVMEEYEEEYEDDLQDYISRAQLKEELKIKIGGVEGEKKVGFAALFDLYGKQQQIDDQEVRQLQQIKHKFRLKTEDLLNKVRKIVAGQSAQNEHLTNSELLTEDQISRGLKGISIPDFWPSVIKNSSFEELIDKVQLPAIDSINNVLVAFDLSKKELSIELHFGQNSVFTDKILKATLTEESFNEIKHKYQSPKYKPHYVRPEAGFFNVFTEVPEDEIVSLYQYWLNFYQEELPQALAFYFQLREGTFHAKVPEDMENGIEGEEESTERPKTKKQSVQKPEKPQCKQQ